jgi:hypothetical protein
VKFIQDSRRPFFLYVPFNAVHAPHQVPDKYKTPYAHLPEPRRAYAGMLAAMDEAVGQILTALDEKGLRQNTLIVFSSDNGGPAPGRVTDNGPLRAQKGTLYEGGVRVAACIAWAGQIKVGSVVKAPLHIMLVWQDMPSGFNKALRNQRPDLGEPVRFAPDDGAFAQRVEHRHMGRSQRRLGAIRIEGVGAMGQSD